MYNVSINVLCFFISEIMNAKTTKRHRKRHGHHKTSNIEENIELDEFDL